MTYRMIFVACAVQHTDAGGDAMLSQLHSPPDQDLQSHAPVELTGELMMLSYVDDI